MQSLDVISVNLWQILISLANLLILFLIIKRFLFKPVKEMLYKRQAELDDKYKTAEEAISRAEESEAYWNEKKSHADLEADEVIKEAVTTAKHRGDKIVAEAQERADDIMARAKSEAELEMEKAEHSIKTEIIDVSALLAGKMLGREINIDDHRNMINSVIEDIGDDK